MNALIQTRIDAKQKAAAEELYRSMGTSLNEAIRIFVAQSLLCQGLPLHPMVPDKPNLKLQKAMAKAQNPDNRTSFNSVQEAMDWLSQDE